MFRLKLKYFNRVVSLAIRRAVEARSLLDDHWPTNLVRLRSWDEQEGVVPERLNTQARR